MNNLLNKIDGQIDILRRISERGIKLAVDERHTHFTDLFQHMLDEIDRTNKLYRNTK